MKLIKYIAVFAIFSILYSCATNNSAPSGQDYVLNVPATTTTNNSAVPAPLPKKINSLSNNNSVDYTTAIDNKSDIWQYIAKNMDLPTTTHRIYKKILKRYISNQDFFDRINNNSSNYLYHVVQEVEKRGMPIFLALLPVIESDYDSYAVSYAGAAGAWQIIPSTAKLLGVEMNWWFDGRLDVISSTDKALLYLENMYDRFGDWKLALAAYNCGPTCVSRAIKKNKRRGRSIAFENLPLPRETREYVPKLFAVATVIQDPYKYDVELEEIINKPVFAALRHKSQVSFVDFANDLDMDIEDLYQLNRGYKHWITHPNKSGYIIVPHAMREEAKAVLNSYDNIDSLVWQRLFVPKNKTVQEMATKVNAPIDLMLDINDINPNEKNKADLVVLMPINKSYSYRHTNKFNSAMANSKNILTKHYYKVKKGDSLWTIATKHNLKVNALLKLNSMSVKKSRIYPGNKILIQKRQNIDYAPLQEKYDRKVIRKISYRVRSGDSVGYISDKFKVTLRNLVEWNSKLKKSLRLRKGQIVHLFVDITDFL